MTSETTKVTYRVKFYDTPGFLLGVSLGKWHPYADAHYVRHQELAEVWDFEVPTDLTQKFEGFLVTWQGGRVEKWEVIPDDWR